MCVSHTQRNRYRGGTHRVVLEALCLSILTQLAVQVVCTAPHITNSGGLYKHCASSSLFSTLTVVSVCQALSVGAHKTWRRVRCRGKELLQRQLFCCFRVLERRPRLGPGVLMGLVRGSSTPSPSRRSQHVPARRWVSTSRPSLLPHSSALTGVCSSRYHKDCS